MYTRRDLKWGVILRFAWSYIILFTVWSVAVVVLHNACTQAGYNCAIPFAPLATIGIAVAFYVGFKNNQAYDRYWEARKVWGGIVNVSRTWTATVIGYVTDDEAKIDCDANTIQETRRALVYRILAWSNALRYQLRRKHQRGPNPRGTVRAFQRQDDINEIRDTLNAYLSCEELDATCGQANPAAQIIRRLAEDLRELRERDGLIDYFRHIALMELLTECYNVQGKCERIKNTPFPRQFAYFSKVFTWIFVTLLPFGLVGEMHAFDSRLVWLTVPFSVVISWIFMTMEMVGDASEDPFENFINDVPMTALCRTIEIDARQMLGESDVPAPIEPENDILM